MSQCMNCLRAISEELVWEGNLEGEGCSPFVALIYIYTCLHSYSALYGILIWYRYIVTLALSLLLTLSSWSVNPNISRSRLFPRSIASFEKSTLWICPGVSICSRRRYESSEVPQPMCNISGFDIQLSSRAAVRGASSIDAG